MGKGARLSAALAYLALTLWAARAILPDLAGTYPYCGQPADLEGDVSHVVWAASRTARTLATAPWRLWEYEFCHPLAHAVALGHHGYGSAVLAALPYWLTGEPVLAHNVASLAMLWLSAIAMYALAFHWTKSVPAAFVAGVVFAFQLERVRFVTTPSIVSCQWTPLVLLFVHRLFDRRRWRDAAALALCASLQVLEGFYQVVPLAVLVLVYGGALAARHRHELLELAPKLVAVGGVVATVLLIVMWPYVHARDVWGLRASHSMYPLANWFAFGDARYPGTTLVALAAIGVGDRLFRRDHDDPRWPLLLAALVLFSLLVGGVVVPGVGMIRSPGRWIVPWIPGMDAVRVPRLLVHGVWLVLGLLAAYGVRRLVERRPAPFGIAVAVVLSALALAETTYPALARATFGVDATIKAESFGVPPQLARFLDAELTDGAVIDLPVLPYTALRQRLHRVRLAAFHRRPLDECMTTHESPLRDDVNALSARLPDPAAVEALHALGFRNVVVHEEYEYPLPALRDLSTRLRRLATGDPRLVPRGAAHGHRVFRLESTTPAATDVALLGAGVTDDGAAVVAAPGSTSDVEFVFHGGGPETFRHPDPIEPSRLVVRWYDGSSTVVAEEHVRLLLPLALAKGDRTSRRATLVTPAAGTYRVTLAPADAPETVVSVARVDVRAE